MEGCVEPQHSRARPKAQEALDRRGGQWDRSTFIQGFSQVSCAATYLECCGPTQPSIQVSSMFDDQEDARISTDFQLESFKKLECVWFLNGGLRRAAALQGRGRRHRKLWTDAVANGSVRFSCRGSLWFPVLRTQLDASCYPLPYFNRVTFSHFVPSKFRCSLHSHIWPVAVSTM